MELPAPRAAAALAAWALLLALCAAPAAAIYADQAGQYDWLQQHIGRVSAAQLGGGPTPTLFAASAAAGTLAALSPSDGRLLWRKVLAPGDAVTQLGAAEGCAVTLTEGGRQLTAWNATTGAALWGALAPGPADLAVAGDAAVLSVGSEVKVRRAAA